MQVIKGEENDDDANEAFYDAEASDAIAQDGYGSTSNNSLRSREYETFNPLHSFSGMPSNVSSDNKKVRDGASDTDQTESFLLNPLHTFVNDDREEDPTSSETTSLLSKSKTEHDAESKKNTSHVALRPSIFTQHD